jgi:hypothetical protein
MSVPEAMGYMDKSPCDVTAVSARGLYVCDPLCNWFYCKGEW